MGEWSRYEADAVTIYVDAVLVEHVLTSAGWVRVCRRYVRPASQAMMPAYLLALRR